MVAIGFLSFLLVFSQFLVFQPPPHTVSPFSTGCRLLRPVAFLAPAGGLEARRADRAPGVSAQGGVGAGSSQLMLTPGLSGTPG